MKRISRSVSGLLGSRLLWRILFVPLILVAGFVAYTLYSGSQNDGGVKHVTVLTSGNAEKVNADVTAQIKTGKAVFFELCSGDTCTDQLSELDKVAAAYEGQILFVQINPHDVPSLAQEAAGAAGKAAYPTHLLVTANGEYAETGIMTADQLTQFITSNLGSNVVKLTDANASQVQKQIQGKDVLYVVCTPDICKLLTPALEQTAVKYKGKVTIVLVDVTSGSQLVDAVAEAVGGYIYPAYVFVNSKGGMLPYAGMLGADEFAQLVEAGLKATPAPATGATPTPAPGTAPATPTPGAN